MMPMDEVTVKNPKRIELLIKGDVVLLPSYGESRVLKEPSFLPASNRSLIVLNVRTQRGYKRLLCARGMCFEYVRFDA